MLGGAYWRPAALIIFLDLLVGVLEAASALGRPHLGSKVRMRGAALGRLWRQSPLMGEGVASWPLSQENLESHLLHFTAPHPTPPPHIWKFSKSPCTDCPCKLLLLTSFYLPQAPSLPGPLPFLLPSAPGLPFPKCFLKDI